MTQNGTIPFNTKALLQRLNITIDSELSTFRFAHGAWHFADSISNCIFANKNSNNFIIISLDYFSFSRSIWLYLTLGSSNGFKGALSEVMLTLTHNFTKEG